jgi:polysaccharide export outer membrane protein
MRLRWFVLAAALAMTASQVEAQSSGRSAVASDSGAVLQPGDQLRVTVWRRPEYSGDFLVAADGTLRHPLFKEVRVAGVPLGTAHQRLREFLTRYEANPEFVIEPLMRVAVGGEVRTPNLYSFAPEVTVAQAVALAGGATDRGRLSAVQVTRGGGRISVDLSRADARGSLMTIRSGDQIVVTRRRNVLTDFILPISSLVAAVGTILQLYRTR